MIQHLQKKRKEFTVNFPFYAVQKTVWTISQLFVIAIQFFFLSSARRFYSQSRIITIYMLFIFRIGNCNTVVMGKAKFLFIIANLYFVSMAFVFNKYLGVFFFLTYVHFKRLNDNYLKKKILTVDFFRVVYILHSVYSLVFGLDFFFQ